MSTKRINIRLEESDLKELEYIKKYLEEQTKNLPMHKKITTTDCIKYAINFTTDYNPWKK